MLRAQRRAIAGLAVALTVGLSLAGCGTPDQTVTARSESASAAAASGAGTASASASDDASSTASSASSTASSAGSAAASGSGGAAAPHSSGSGAPASASGSGTPASTPAPNPQPSDGVLITGDVISTIRLTVGDLAALPQQTRTVTYEGAGGSEPPTETGPFLIDVLDQAGLRLDPSRPNDVLSFTVLAVGATGQQAVLSLGELSPEFSATPAILSLNQDGVALASGPMLVVPGDVGNARYVPGVVELRVTRVD